MAFPPATPGRYVRLTFSSPLTGAGGTDLLRTDNSGYECDNCSIRRYITGGVVASVPEPSNLTMIPIALAIAALLRRVRLRGKRTTFDADPSRGAVCSHVRAVILVALG